MKIQLPSIEFSADRDKIRANRDLIKEASYAGGGFSHTDCEDCGGRVP